jgi:hypothetical protein
MLQDRINLDEFKSSPHPYKATLKKHGVAVTTVANYLGMTYQYVYNTLSGHIKMSKRMEEKLSPLIQQLESEAE